MVALHVQAQQNSEALDLKKHKIVMQFTDNDSLSQATVTGQVKNIRTAWPNAEIEVVCHGPGLDLLMTRFRMFDSSRAVLVLTYNRSGMREASP